MASSEYGQGFSAGAKTQLYSTIALLKDYKAELYEDAQDADDAAFTVLQVARAEAVQKCLRMIGGPGTNG
jgi:hypothetical protein